MVAGTPRASELEVDEHGDPGFLRAGTGVIGRNDSRDGSFGRAPLIAIEEVPRVRDGHRILRVRAWRHGRGNAARDDRRAKTEGHRACGCSDLLEEDAPVSYSIAHRSSPLFRL